ncbi:hypothetical protein M422DRAFT_35429 [Sphaerobolus stellatus SS14]|uniref:Peptidase S59 domain-containing protein n=1 Tax=Sphaerobolus stellatus (strain SS14) TaxID=990650 RepID=A0A0C9TTB4_SPHS4|nr:hypothetical protein M422DRAFT_35429 [Sphaerobolus stellatus SS14]
MSIFGNFAQNNNNQQQQQQPQQTNAFGQPSTGFGNPGGFGAFAQNNQGTQQPQVNPMFGGLAGGTSNTPSTGGFGAFANPTANSAFGQPKPAFGSTGTSTFGAQPSAFGSTSGTNAFGGGSAFGGTSGSAFGQTSAQPQQSAFGSGNSLFKPQGTGFGSTALVTSSTSAVPTTGTANPPYQETQERDANSNAVSHYQSITCMPAYKNASFEELRLQDYQQGRKTANAPGAFGATPGFGQQPAQPSTGFGTATTTAFGQPQPATSAFGAFGAQPQQQQQQQPQPNAFGTFSQPAQQPQATSGFGAFAQQNQQPQQQPSAFGAFNQPQQPQQPQQQPSSGFSAFGQQNKPFSAFGAQPQNTPAFGAFGGTNTSTTSAFGQNQPQQNQSAFGGGGGFGQQTQNPLMKPSVFGASTGTFGQQTQPSAFGTAGQTQQQQGGLFGSNNQQQQPSAFGTQPAQQQQQQPGSIFGGSQPSTGLFGNANQNQQQNQQQQQQGSTGPGFGGSLFPKPAGNGLFGNSTAQPAQPTQNPNPSNPLFGGGSGLFGNNNQNAQQPVTTNPLFANANTGSSIFGNKTAAPSTGFGLGGGIFGGNANTAQQQQAPAAGGGGLFSNSTAAPSQPQGGSPFGGSSFLGSTMQQQQQQQQPSLTASLDQPLPSTLPTLPPLASSMSPNKKKTNVFADAATRSSPRLGFGHSSGLGYAPPSTGPKLRGFGTSVTSIERQSQNNGKPAGLPFAESKSLLSPEAFTNGAGGSLQLLGGAKQSVKKLVLDKRTDEDDLHRMRTQQGGATSSSKGREVRFNPALGVAARERDNDTGRAKTPVTQRAASATPADSPPAKAAEASSDINPQHGEYWCLPTVAELQRLSFSELQAVKDFTVGRVGYGTLQFLEPVDLTAVPSIAEIPGKIVSFETNECTLYTDENMRPPAGEGLNVPARIKLDNCWAIDKSTRVHIKDPNDPRWKQRVRKMQNQPGADFVHFDNDTGVWEFTVKEF